MEKGYESKPFAPISERPERAVYPQEARRQFLFEIFEDSEDLVEHDQEGFAFLGEGFHLEEMAEEAEERAERFMKAQRQLVAGFFARRKNRLYRRAATVVLCQPDRPEPTLLLLWNLLEERWFEVDADTEEDVNRWLSGLSEDDFFFFTQDPDLDPQRVMAAGVLPRDLRPMRLFQEFRSRLLRTLMKRCDFFHPDHGVFDATLKQQLPSIAGDWDLDEVELADLAREERKRFYLLHLSICKASAAFAHSQPAPASVPQEVVAEVASVAYGRMNHPEYKSQALSFAGLQEEQARAIFSHLGRFMEEFYASRLFTFLKRAMLSRRVKISRIEPVIRAFVKTFRTGIRPDDLGRELSRQIAALALFETYFGGFRGNGVSNGRPNTGYRPQILTWGGFADLEEAKQVYEAIPNRKAMASILFSEISKMKSGKPAESPTVTTGTITIHTRSIQTAGPGAIATYRWGPLRELEDGRLFAPSDELLSVYKRGTIGWEDYERRYLAEMREAFRTSPDEFRRLFQKSEITLVCYESEPSRCHRRLLANLLEKVARKLGLQVILDIQ